MITEEKSKPDRCLRKSQKTRIKAEEGRKDGWMEGDRIKLSPGLRR